jgi:hypothetical protein
MKKKAADTAKIFSTPADLNFVGDAEFYLMRKN